MASRFDIVAKGFFLKVEIQKIALSAVGEEDLEKECEGEGEEKGDKDSSSKRHSERECGEAEGGYEREDEQTEKNRTVGRSRPDACVT